MIYLVLGIVALGMLSGIGYKVRESGKDAVRLEWKTANEKADAEQKKRLAAADKTAKQSAADLAAAQQKGRVYEAKWKAERSKVPDSRLASCSGGPTASAPGGAAPALPPDSGVRLRLSYEFVRLYDHAWTGADGQPVFRHPATAAGAGASAAPGPGEVLDIHQVNAQRCSEDRRALNALRAQIQRLEKGWR